VKVTRPAVGAHVAAVRSGSRTGIGRVLTLVESTRAEDREVAREVLADLAPYAGNVCRIGITGVPGSGKSTLIDVLGSLLTARGHRVAVLAVDPSSPRNGGSVLGDRTRMNRLTADPAAFIRASPSAGTLGGVADRTAEAMVVMAAAGHDVILVETVGTGQSETQVADLVDLVLLLTVAGTGDSMQGIKMGVLEVADLIVVNKADLGAAAAAAARELAGALRLLGGRPDGAPPVLTCSSRTGEGVEEIWSRLHRLHTERTSAGRTEARRREQRVAQVWRTVRSAVLAELETDTAARSMAEGLAPAVRAGEIAAAEAARRILRAFHESES
jgi:LAO/AO transport system kinase